VQSAELAGESALVTGGGRGIGANIARELASAGMRVVVSARSRDQVDSVAGEIDGVGVAGDVSNVGDVRRMVD
jgi:NAD(P)-dependent dehydrogenase (short-subunit alcohol dehydrogenase family)